MQNAAPTQVSHQPGSQTCDKRDDAVSWAVLDTPRGAPPTPLSQVRTPALRALDKWPDLGLRGSSCLFNSARPQLPPLRSILPPSISTLLPPHQYTARPYLPYEHHPLCLCPFMDQPASPPQQPPRRGRRPRNPKKGAESPRTRKRNERARKKAEREGAGGDSAAQESLVRDIGRYSQSATKEDRASMSPAMRTQSRSHPAKLYPQRNQSRET